MEKAIRERLTGAVILFAALAILVPEMLSGPGEVTPGPEADALADTGPPLTTYELSLDPSAPAALRQTAPAEAARSLAEAVPPPVAASLDDPSGAGATGSGAAPEEAAATVAGPVAGADNASAGSGAPPRAAAAPPTIPEAVPQRATPATSPPVTSRPATSPPATSPPATPAATAPATATATATAAAAGQWWVQLGSFSSEQNARGLASRLGAKGFTIQVSKVRSGNRDLYRVRAGPERSREAATALRGRLAAAGEQGTLVAP